jgi:type IV secretion system protein VirB4
MSQASDYCGGFGLTAHELDLVRSLPEHLRCVLIKQGGNSVVARLDMGNMPDAITVLSGRESSVRKLDELRRVHGDAPSEWMPLLLQDAQEVAFAPGPAATTGMQS